MGLMSWLFSEYGQVRNKMFGTGIYAGMPCSVCGQAKPDITHTMGIYLAEKRLGFPHGDKIRLHCVTCGNKAMDAYEQQISNPEINQIKMRAMEYGMRFRGIK